MKIRVISDASSEADDGMFAALAPHGIPIGSEHEVVERDTEGVWVQITHPKANRAITLYEGEFEVLNDKKENDK